MHLYLCVEGTEGNLVPNESLHDDSSRYNKKVLKSGGQEGLSNVVITVIHVIPKKHQPQSCNHGKAHGPRDRGEK